MELSEKKEYVVRGMACYDRKCFTPFSGNGIKICRLYEMGRCPEKYRVGFNSKNEKKGGDL